MARLTAKSGSRILDPSNRESAAWTLYELDYVWREAQADADLAYRDWCRFPGRDAYVVYRAAQDRADAAQDELAAWVCGTSMIGHEGKPVQVTDHT
jgi:hypothetical protein